MIGQLLNGRYQITQILTKSRMSQTYLAQDMQIPDEAKCLVKQLKHGSHDPAFLHQARSLFQQEAKILHQLGSDFDRIPRLLAYFEEGEEFYLVQEFIEGEPLSKEMGANRHWSESQVRELLKEVLEILKFIHSHKVIHRDIKPENIIRRKKDGKLVLIDFGAVKKVQISQSSNSSATPPGYTPTEEINNPNYTPTEPVNIRRETRETDAIGTRGYMPPEQAKAKPHFSSDLYALGMVAIYALTGKQPTQLSENQYGEIVWGNLVKVSKELELFLNQMVRHYVDYRYQTAQEALQALQQPTPKPKPNPDSVAPLDKKRRKSILLISTIVLLAIGMVTGVIFLIYKYIDYRKLEIRLAQLETSKQRGDLDTCINQAQEFPENNPELYNQAEKLGNDCKIAQDKQRLDRAKSFQVSLQCEAALKEIRQTYSFSNPSLDPSTSEEIKVLIDKCSDQTFQLAKNQFKEGNVDRAVAWAKVIPEGSSAYQEAENAINNWPDEAKANEEYLSQANTAQDRGDWDSVIREAGKVTSDYKKREVDSLIKESINDKGHLNDALDALKRSNWDTAIEAAKKLVTDYGKDQAKMIIDDAQYLPNAQKSLKECRWEDAKKEANKLKTGFGQEEKTRITKEATPILFKEGRLNNGEYREHEFEGKAGQRVTITMVSEDFDTYLSIHKPDGEEIASNDDSFNNKNSSITVKLPANLTYSVRARYYPGLLSAEGNYKVTVYLGEACQSNSRSFSTPSSSPVYREPNTRSSP